MLQFLWHFAETADSCDPPVPPLTLSALSPPLPIACHMIFGRCLAAGWLVFKCALAQCGFLWASLSGFVLCFIFWVPVVVVCTLWELAGSAPKQLLFIITFYVYILHSAFTFYFVQALAPFVIPSISLNCCISLHFTAWHLRWLIKGHAQCQDSLE